VLLLKGRIHNYEGFDLSEAQLQVRTLAEWGVKRLLVTSAAGAVALGLAAGDVVLVREVLDLQDLLPGGTLVRVPATAEHLTGAAFKAPTATPSLVPGIHAAVPGPQYETAAELSVLRALGATTVSMSGPAEIRAAREEGLETAMLSVVTNVGATSHEDVLMTTARANDTFTWAVTSILDAWASTDPSTA